MKTQWGWISGLVLAVIATSATVTKADPLRESRVPGEVLVKLVRRAEPGAEGLRRAMKNIAGGVEILEAEALQEEPRLVRVRFEDDSKISAVLERFAADSRIEYAEPNFIYHASEWVNRSPNNLSDGVPDGTPNDEHLDQLWHLINRGQVDSSGKAGVVGMDLGVAQLWARGITGSKRVVVGVIDTGIDLKHPDLIPNLYVNPGEADEKATNGIDDDGNGYIDDVHGWNFEGKNALPIDDQGHGTHCAGSIGARGGNQLGVVGINWQVSLMPLKFLSADGRGTLSSAVNAIRYGVRMGAKVLSNSWGGPQKSQALEEAIAEAERAGVLFVAAAGNEGENADQHPSFPAAIEQPNVVSVAAIDNRGEIAKFSNVGSRSVHVAAPGVRVFSTYSTLKGLDYKAMSGTSMACPQVAGLAALMLSVDPSLSYSEIKQRLIRSSEPMPAFRGLVYSGGRINAWNAVQNLIPQREEPAESDWHDVPSSVESPHPYPNGSNLIYELSVPGARFLRVVFSRIETEYFYDKITVENPQGHVFDSFMGRPKTLVSLPVPGEYLRIRLKSDRTTKRYGFSVAKLQYAY